MVKSTIRNHRALNVLWVNVESIQVLVVKIVNRVCIQKILGNHLAKYAKMEKLKVIHLATIVVLANMV